MQEMHLSRALSHTQNISRRLNWDFNPTFPRGYKSIVKTGPVCILKLHVYFPQLQHQGGRQKLGSLAGSMQGKGKCEG